VLRKESIIHFCNPAIFAASMAMSSRSSPARRSMIAASAAVAARH
jgi:hypothetical protein